MASLQSDAAKLSAEETAGEDFFASDTEPESTEKEAADSVVSTDHKDEIRGKEEGALGGEEDEPLEVPPADEEFSNPPGSTAFGDDEEADPGATEEDDDEDDDNDDVE